MDMKQLKRRLEALENRMAQRDTALERICDGVFRRLSTENLEALIDASLARLHRRDLTKREADAQQEYFKAVESECRALQHRAMRTGMPNVNGMIFHAAMRQWSTEDLALLCDGLRAQVHGFKPTAEQLTDAQAFFAAQEEAHYRWGSLKKDQDLSRERSANKSKGKPPETAGSCGDQAPAQASLASPSIQDQPDESIQTQLEPIVMQQVAQLAWSASMQAQYQRVGFASEAEYKTWYQRENSQLTELTSREEMK